MIEMNGFLKHIELGVNMIDLIEFLIWGVLYAALFGGGGLIIFSIMVYIEQKDD